VESKRSRCLLYATAALLVVAQFGATAVAQQQTKPRLRGYYTWKSPAHLDAATVGTAMSSGATLPLWTFDVHSTRDGLKYPGVMVGRNPFTNPGSVTVPTKVVPLIIVTHEIGTSVNSSGIISTTPGKTVFNPTVADTACLNAPNDVPTKLFAQSPILRDATFDFGGTIVGTTQYEDAFQRANFWRTLGSRRDEYHVLLSPQFLKPVYIDVPAQYGLALATTSLGPPAFCAPMGIVDIAWFDNYLNSTVIPKLAAQGVNPTTFPIFFVHNLVWASPVTNLGSCCALGYHSLGGFPVPTQTYSPADFDSTGLFGTAAMDTAVMSHEVGEWMNDPFTINPTPLWGHTGQVGGCQGNLEVGDPLTGNSAPNIAMPNGFTYHLQELAFFSWFFGKPSIGVNGWFSDNGTFLTDAGPPCVP
jgi:hypothetical protein